MAAEIKLIPYNKLDTPVKEHVIKFLQAAIEQSLGAFTLAGQIGSMLDQINPMVKFIKHEDGRKEMEVDESDERISKFLFEAFEAQLRKDPEVMKKIILASTRRVDGTDRMKIK